MMQMAPPRNQFSCRVHAMIIAQDHPDFRFTFKSGEHLFDLFREPDVVLIAEKSHVFFAEEEGSVEIGAPSQILFVLKNADGERCRFSKSVKDLHRRVRRAVVADHQFIRKDCLFCQRIQLFLKILCAVKRDQRDGSCGPHKNSFF